MNMFWKLLEAVIKCMIVFQELMKNVYSNEKSDYFKENTYENEVLLHDRKKLNIHASAQYENRKSWLEQMPEAATWGVLRKKGVL